MKFVKMRLRTNIFLKVCAIEFGMKEKFHPLLSWVFFFFFFMLVATNAQTEVHLPAVSIMSPAELKEGRGMTSRSNSLCLVFCMSVTKSGVELIGNSLGKISFEKHFD